MAEGLAPPPSVSELRAVPPEIHVLPAGAVLWRIYFRAGEHPGRWNRFQTFGPTGARFDHQPPPPRTHRKRSILYASDSGVTCVAEVFQEGRTIDRFRDAPALAAFRTHEPLELLDLSGAWPARAGASMTINSGSRSRARDGSRQIYADSPYIHGRRYASSMNTILPALALSDRARPAVPAPPELDHLLADSSLPALLADAALRLGYGML